MFGKTISHSQASNTESQLRTKRRFSRRYDDHCVVIVHGQMHPVENWSKGGLLMTADDRLFAKGQEFKFTLKFKLRDEIIEVDHKAKIARKSSHKVALEFSPLTRAVKAQFQKVVDDFVAQRFAESQS